MSILGYIVAISLLAFFGFWAWAAYELVIKE